MASILEFGLADDSSSRPPIVVAVSGGVDSVVLLDILAKSGQDNLIIAHVDHGIREDSASDARFVEKLAKEYRAKFESKTLHLGKNTSEDTARIARYDFLRSIADKYQARIATAHHGDDVIETIAINVTRGTGWRGLAVLGAKDIDRPLTSMFKSEIYEYAKSNELDWREDSTNATDRYLRNRLRVKCQTLNEDEKLQLLSLWSRQRELTGEIDEEVGGLITNARHFYIMNSEKVGIEVLRNYLIEHNVRLTTPQLRRVLHAVMTMHPGKQFALGKTSYLNFTTTTFHVEMDK